MHNQRKEVKINLAIIIGKACGDSGVNISELKTNIILQGHGEDIFIDHTFIISVHFNMTNTTQSERKDLQLAWSLQNLTKDITFGGGSNVFGETSKELINKTIVTDVFSVSDNVQLNVWFLDNKIVNGIEAEIFCHTQETD
jgi:hypothetical protein